MLSVERRRVRNSSRLVRLRVWNLEAKLSTEVRMVEPVWLMSFSSSVGTTVVCGSGEGVEGVVVFVTPVGKLLSVVVAAVVVVVGLPVFWIGVVEGVEDVLNTIDKGFFWGIIPEV
jgi:hypothetical protein